MDHIVAIMLVCLAVSRGGRGGYLGYGGHAADFGDEYEPVAVAAVPLRLLAAAEPEYVYWYEQDGFERPARGSPGTRPQYAGYRTSSAEREPPAPAPALLYARPDRGIAGGYSYRRKPSRPPAAAAAAPMEAIIIRVHKYKVVED